MSDRIIRLREVFESSALATRQSVRDLVEMMQAMSEENIHLDFSGIETVSRSFFDELLAREKYLRSQGKDLSYENLSLDIAQMMELVQTSDSRSMPYQTIGNAVLTTM
ncbi:MAG TPA: DUF4325 domain-containing protein [Candidatus Peribacterales bacterium]|nr:DUF4325 domain-containing protein [Candidatus Peribacterales bacterium]